MAEPRKPIDDKDERPVTAAAGEKPQARGAHSASHSGSAPRRLHRHSRTAWPPPRRTRREFLAVPSLHVGRAGAERSTGGARRATIISMCASANGKPRIRSGCGPTARRRWSSRRRCRNGASSTARWSCPSRWPKCWCRAASASAFRTLMRPTANRNVIETMAQRDHARPRPSGRACRRISRRRRFRKSCCCRTCGARSPTSAAPSASLPPMARAATSCRSSIRRKKRFPIPAASNSSSRKGLAASPPAAPRPGATITRSCVANHRAALRAETEQFGWTFTVHRTDRGPTELLFALHARMGANAVQTAVNSRHAPAQSRERRIMGALPLAFAQPLVLLGLLSLPVLWWLLRLVPPRPRRIDFPPTRLLVRNRAEGRNAVAHAVVADLVAADAGRAGHLRRRRSVVESAARGVEQGSAAAHPDRRRLGGGRRLGRAAAHRR